MLAVLSAFAAEIIKLFHRICKCDSHLTIEVVTVRITSSWWTILSNLYVECEGDAVKEICCIQKSKQRGYAKGSVQFLTLLVDILMLLMGNNQRKLRKLIKLIGKPTHSLP